MTHSRTFRVLFVGALAAVSIAVTAVALLLLWPAWREYRLMQSFAHAVARDDFEAVKRLAIDLRRSDGDDAVVSFFCRATEDADAQIREWALALLANFEPQGDSVEPIAPTAKARDSLLRAIERSFNDSDARVRYEAFHALICNNPAQMPCPYC